MPVTSTLQPDPGTVAIVGIGGIFPDAPVLTAFWDNIRHGRSAARDVPAGRWLIPPDAAFDPEAGAADSVYSRRGCFIDQLPGLSTLSDLAIDPEVLAGLDPLFHLLLHAGKRAFDDGVTARLDLSRVGVIIGNLALPSEKSSLLSRQWLARIYEENLTGRCIEAATADPLNRYVAGLPAGLLAQALGLGGGGCTLDAACASSLYAIKLAADELLAGRTDAMLTGGVSRPDPLYTQMGFSQLRALSRRGICSPFDAAGDGLVVGEGAGIFLLKRTADALAHGDRIYGIIKGVGLASDVGGSLLAPLSEGQLRAMRAAYLQAGWEPTDVDLIECHATGTPVGDATEIASLRALWENRATAARCVIGSVKSNIGHLLTAAGAAALTKVLLAMREETLPPTANFTATPPGIDLDTTPFRILTTGTEWKRRSTGIPRRAAVSAFGFGGINAHLLVEEWLPPEESPPGFGIPCSVCLPAPAAAEEPPLVAVVGMDARFGGWQSLRSFQERVLGGGDVCASPGRPGKWWGAEKSAWFSESALGQNPFAGFYVDEVTAAADEFRIPPREMEEMLPQQLLMLQSAAGAMADAGLGREGNLTAGVFIGIALDLNSTNFSFRWSLEERAAALAREHGLNLSREEMAAWISELRDAAGPPLTANRTMGALGSVVASRIAREFKVGGPSFTLSNEENSGIRALEVAVRRIQGGEIDRALVGAVDLAGDLRAVLGHHAGRPFSPSGNARPFDQAADGSIVGEGAAAVVLKRLVDAERDGDRIYAVIRGIGNGGGATVVPGEAAFRRALDAAYAEAGIDPGTIGYLEANGSGRGEEDRMEAAVLAEFFGSGHPGKDRRRRCAVSSIKGDIGHCGAASGLASLIRGCLALYQEIIPSNRGTQTPLPELSGTGPLFLPGAPRYWLRDRTDGPRRAGINSFSIDGTCSHVILEGRDSPSGTETEKIAPVGPGAEFLFSLTAESPSDLSAGLARLRRSSAGASGRDLAALARDSHGREGATGRKRCTIALVARDREELDALIEQGERLIAADGETRETIGHPSLRDRVFYTPTPLGDHGNIAFVFPGSGNHYPGMGLGLSSRWPEIFRRQDGENLHLRGQFQPELFWNGAAAEEIHEDHRAVIFGQVAAGCAVSDLVRSFGVHPQAVIGYSLGESAGLFALRAWRDRDGMLARMNASTLFTDDLAGECRAARLAWGLGDDKTIEWSIGVVDAPAGKIRRLLHLTPRVYLLIVNTPDECVIGGDAKGVKRLVAMAGCRFFPLHGVTTVHCEVARHVAQPYRDLHLFETTAPAQIAFYSGARGSSYPVDRESAADAILAQALDGVDFPAVIETAYREGVRYFLEMGPGSSCSRMISRILSGRPHLARSASYAGQDENSTLLRLLAQLISEGIPVDLTPLFAAPAIEAPSSGKEVRRSNLLRIPAGGKSFTPSFPSLRPRKGARVADEAMGTAASGNALPAPDTETGSASLLQHDAGSFSPGQVSLDSLITGFAASQDAVVQAHEAFLRFTDGVTNSLADSMALQLSLQETLEKGRFPAPPDPRSKGAAGTAAGSWQPGRDAAAPSPATGPTRREVAYDRDMCLAFARGKVADMLGPDFREADTFPTRVRLPDEPLMLVDRIITLEGEARSMTSGRVVTEHDIHRGAWYLDGGRIPTCIAVEAGQADLFLSGYLGIDFVTRGLAVYRLLDAVVTFHRKLPQPGETITYDIRIDHFFRQGETCLFRFSFEATVNGLPLLTMRDGCAGFFTSAELDAGKGIVRPALDIRSGTGTRPGDWQDLVPMSRESYDAARLDRLRTGDLSGCFGSLFDALSLTSPLTIPGGRMRLVHRVTEIDPNGGRYGLGLIRAEADVHPDDWFLTCHFVDDRVMPGTLMYECCLHTLRIFLLRMGWIAEAGEASWEPVPGVASRLRCRGQVLETTKVATYEVSIRELGYAPEPYAVVDALMFADGRPVVEITDMSVRLAGTTKERLIALWRGRATGGGCRDALRCVSTVVGDQKPALYTKQQILAYSNGKPSEAFGEAYRVFDEGRIIARLPGPPYQFLDRITCVTGEPWRMTAGAAAEGQYDVPPDAWYFAVDRQPRMPFAVLLEVALQPCGWLAAYVGSALTSPTDLSFRNLGGTAVQHRPVTPATGTVTASAVMKKVATSGGMIIQEYDFTVSDANGPLYEGDTMFGFFSREALAHQVGVREAAAYAPTAAETERGRSCSFPHSPPFPEKQLRMVDRIELFVHDGGPARLGYLRGVKEVDPDEWFFKAHFYQDPVTPGSLGLEAFLQLVKFAAVERWGWQEGRVLSAVALGRQHRWLYRGQVLPTSRQVTVETWITAVDDRERLVVADGFLAVDGRVIYQMNDFALRME